MLVVYTELYSEKVKKKLYYENNVNLENHKVMHILKSD
jgi:hypothetical protein